MNADATTVHNNKRCHLQVLLRVTGTPLLTQGGSLVWKEIHKHEQISDYKVLSIEAHRRDNMRVHCTNFASTYCQEDFQETKVALLYNDPATGRISHYTLPLPSTFLKVPWAVLIHTSLYHDHIIIQEGTDYHCFTVLQTLLSWNHCYKTRFFTSFKI
jgi:hypothetical protein